jgi:hypothetical protein
LRSVAAGTEGPDATGSPDPTARQFLQAEAGCMTLSDAGHRTHQVLFHRSMLIGEFMTIEATLQTIFTLPAALGVDCQRPNARTELDVLAGSVSKLNLLLTQVVTVIKHSQQSSSFELHITAGICLNLPGFSAGARFLHGAVASQI